MWCLVRNDDFSRYLDQSLFPELDDFEVEVAPEPLRVEHDLPGQALHLNLQIANYKIVQKSTPLTKKHFKYVCK